MLSLPLPRSLGPKILNPPHHHRLRPIATASSPSVFPNSAIQRIADKLRSLGYIEDPPKPQTNPPGSAGEIFIPTPHHLPNRRVGHTLDPSWSSPDQPVPEPGASQAMSRLHELSAEVERERRRAKKEEEEDPPMAAELLIGVKELKRLRTVGIAVRKRLKIGKAGITEGVVNGIHERWRSAEVVKIKCEDLCRINMKRTHEILERKTGGLVIWRSGSTIIIYRGVNYKYPYFTDGHIEENNNAAVVPTMLSLYGKPGKNLTSTSLPNDTELLEQTIHPPLVMGVGSPKRLRFQLPGEAQLEAEADKLLDGLGPRFTDWWGNGPLPIDADLLPPIVPGFRKPFRLLPFGVSPKLTDREMTTLRRLGRPLPCHFALGRNRNLQGLATSMIKLWERCEIAKIAVKRGVRNMNSVKMADELKRLTGGTLLSRDKDFIVFYRGKDFLPLAVSYAIEERRNGILHKKAMVDEDASAAGSCPDQESIEQVMLDRVKEANTKTLPSERKRISSKETSKSIEGKLMRAIAKKIDVEKTLQELEKSEGPLKLEADKESISKEERYMLRRIGLKMKPFLLMGRRGAFDGTVENMHLHWKYRELVKILARNRPVEEVLATAHTLEEASGGILVAVERVNKGYAVIVYRGKNYRRPTSLRPRTLLNKKEAYKRYLENQRQESLKHHILKLNEDIHYMKHKLAQEGQQVDIVHSSDLQRSDHMCKNLENAMSVPFVDQCSDKLGDEINASQLHKFLEAEVADPNSDSSFVVHESCCEDGLDLISSPPALDCGEILEAVEFSVPEEESVQLEELEDTVLGEGFAEVETQNICFDMPLTSLNCLERTCVCDNTSPHRLDVKEFPDEDENTIQCELGKSFETSALSNKERLILRKQALKMRQRRVLAVGRNNIVSGVAKAIKEHFRKYPLAIVNIKGIAEGTSVQEVIFELERATGAVLVSREPSKVILYRGWREEDDGSRKGKSGDISNSMPAEIPLKLLHAIRMEAGFPSEPEEHALISDEERG